jgi:hypothetical protein
MVDTSRIAAYENLNCRAGTRRDSAGLGGTASAARRYGYDQRVEVFGEHGMLQVGPVPAIAATD